MNPRPIGVFDSGVGGLTVFHALERALPREPMVYLGDTARVPYGTRSAETVVRYSLEAAQFLRRHRIKMLVVACNTASSVALGPLAEEARVPVLGVILPGARRAVERTRRGRIGVIGTRATIHSGAYPAEIRALRSEVEVLSRPCPLFVPLAEEGWTDNAVARAAAEQYLAPLKAAEIDTLVLGCTHYPLLKGVIGETMGGDVRLVDSAESVAAEARRHLEEEPELAVEPGTSGEPAHRFFVTDAPEPFQHVAERFLGRPIELEQAPHLSG
jgi:glutamate racemase